MEAIVNGCPCAYCLCADPLYVPEDEPATKVVVSWFRRLLDWLLR